MEEDLKPQSDTWKEYFPENLVPVAFTNAILAGDPKGMVKKWKQGQGCDVTLIAEDMKMLPCHREVLEKLGEPMKQVLTENMNPLNGREIIMKDMHAEFVSALIGYAYTGKITLNASTVLDIYDGSVKCQIPYLQDRCVDFVIDNIKYVNYLSLFVLADERGWVRMKEAMWKHCIKHFSDIVEDPGFLRLPPGVLLELLRSEELLVGDLNNVPPPYLQEKRIWESVQRYVDYNTDERAGYLIGFLQHIRLPLMAREDLQQVEQASEKFDDEDVRFILAKAKKVRATLDSFSADDATLVWKRPRAVTPLQMTEGVGFADRKFSIIRTYPEEVFDDVFNSPWVHVSGMKLYFRTWEKTKFILSAIRVFYSNGQQRLHGTEFKECYDVNLDPEERIIKVEGGAGCMIDRLEFHTNKGRTLGPFGGKGGVPVSDAPPKSLYCHLAGITGVLVDTEGAKSVRRVKFKWAYC